METEAYPKISTEEFDNRLQAMVEEYASTLLSIPGIYEVVSEFFNNDIIDDYADDNAHYLEYETVLEMFTDGLTVKELSQKYDDDIALREDFNNYTDSLCKDGQISDWAYNNWDNPF